MGDDGTAPSRQRIGQGHFKGAADARNAAPLVSRLGEIGLDDQRVAELAGLVRRAGSLIFQRPDPSGQKARDDFLDTLRAGMAAIASAVDLQDYDSAVATLRAAEGGHLKILATLGRCDISNRPVAERLSAGIALAERRLDEIRTLMELALQSAGALILPGGVALADPDGRPISPDALITAVVQALGGTLKMEAYGAKLFTKGGWIELPALPIAKPDDIALFAPSEYLGMAWTRWERFHQKARYLDQTIEELEGETLPEGCPASVQTVFTRAEEVNFLDWVANERGLDREGLSHAGLLTTTNVGKLAKGLDGPVAAAPAEWISTDEVAQSLSLSEAVGYEIVKDTERPGGLTLSQWVRGYIVLATWAEAQAEAASGVLQTTREDLLELLTRVSFTEAEADVFFNAVSFGRRSRDLWDAPIVRTKGGWLVVGAAVSGPRLGRTIPSLLASMDIKLERKGSAFEQRVIEFLRRQDLDARAVTVRRDGEEYQYDALVPWGGRLLLIECKNRGLSGNDPVQAYHFQQGVEEDIDQVRRLAGALGRWPEIVTNEFGLGAKGLEVVPIVLQNETYSLPGAVDGVYVYDWSALTRFFEAGWFRVWKDHRLAEGITIRNRVAVKQIWSGEIPTVEDLLAELEEPHQISVLLHHAVVERSQFEIDEHTVVLDWTITRLPMTTESAVEAAGGSPEAVMATLKAVDEQIEAAAAKHGLGNKKGTRRRGGQRKGEAAPGPKREIRGRRR